MTIEELIKKYQTELNESIDKKSTTSAILKQIDALTYAESKMPVSITDKRRILIGVKKAALLKERTCFAQNNNEHLVLLNKAIETLGGKKS